MDAANEIEAIVTIVQNGNDMHTILSQSRFSHVCPRPFKIYRGDKVRFVYTDLEPDDVCAVACLRQSHLAVPLITVFTVSPDGKDSGGIFVKKLIMASTVLGLDFLRDLIIVTGEDKGELPAPYDSVSRIDALTRTAEQLLHASSLQKTSVVEMVLIAPGHGNLAQLDRLLRSDRRWPTLASKCKVVMYSGQYNTREPNMLRGDYDAIAGWVRDSGRPLTDLAHHPFMGKANPRLEGLAALCPNLGRTLTEANPYAAAAWLVFAREFDADLVRPDHPKLFTSPLTELEKFEFASLEARFLKGDVRGYCEGLSRATFAAKIAGYKRGTLFSLAREIHDGPLCDSLVHLCTWLRENHPQHISQHVGGWAVDHQTGYTSIVQAAGMCPAEVPYLVDPADPTIADLLEEELQRALREAICSRDLVSGCNGWEYGYGSLGYSESIA